MKKDDEGIDSLTNKQILTGIQDLVREQFGWRIAYLMQDGKIAGVIMGTSEIIKKAQETKQKGKKNEKFH